MENNFLNDEVVTYHVVGGCKIAKIWHPHTTSELTVFVPYGEMKKYKKLYAYAEYLIEKPEGM